jgi:hypothetical protein
VAVATLSSVIVLSQAGDELLGPLKVRFIRWVVKAGIAGKSCVLHESSSGNPAALVWESVSNSPKWVDESLYDVRLPRGLRVETIDDGVLYVYTQ